MLKRQTLLLVALILTAIPSCAWAYGGWDYAHPEDAGDAVLALIFKGTPILWIAYFLTAFLLFININDSRSRLPELFILLGWFVFGMWYVVQLEYRGAPGPNHVAVDIAAGVFLFLFIGLFVRAWIESMGRSTGPHAPRRRRIWRWSMGVLEAGVFVASIVLSYQLAPGALARDGQSKCEMQLDFATAAVADEFQKTGRRVSLDDPSMYLNNPELVRCPISGEKYVLNPPAAQGDSQTVTCPYHHQTSEPVSLQR